MGPERNDAGVGNRLMSNETESRLHKSEGMVSALLESAAQGILSIDRTGRIVLVNHRAEEMFGYTREELVGAEMELLIPESKRGKHIQDRADYFAHPRSRPMGIGMGVCGVAVLALHLEAKRWARVSGAPPVV